MHIFQHAESHKDEPFIVYWLPSRTCVCLHLQHFQLRKESRIQKVEGYFL